MGDKANCCHSNLSEYAIRIKGKDLAYSSCNKCSNIWIDMEDVYGLNSEYDNSKKRLVSNFPCPRCREIFLESVDLINDEKLKLLQCRKCSGIKMDLRGYKLPPKFQINSDLEEFVDTLSGAFGRELGQKKIKKLPPEFKIQNSEETDYKCPSCSSMLTKYSTVDEIPGKGAEFEICDSCFGIWLDREDMVRKNLSRKMKKLNVDMDNIMPTKRTCPKCKNTTLVSLKYKELETVIDCCPSCTGTWLDGGELAEFSSFLGIRGQEVIDVLINNAIFKNPVLTNVLKQFSRTLHKLDNQNKEQVENLDQAKEIQEKLIFGDKEHNALVPIIFDRFKILSHWIPAKIVGGDYFAVIPYSFKGKELLGLCIADVSGKGLPASLLMANLQALLHSFAPGTDSPAELCTKINSILHNFTTSNKFITFFYGILDPASGVFKYCNAGHNPPVFLSNERIHWLKEGGSVLSFFPEWEYQEGKIDLNEGDRILFYTDGVSETENPKGEEFGEARIAALLKSLGSENFTETMKLIIREIQEYNKGNYNDDTTFLMLEMSKA